MPNKRYKNANHYRINSENISKSLDQDLKINDDTLFVPEGKFDPEAEFYQLMAKLRKDHPKFAPYLIGDYDPDGIESMRNFDVIDVLDNEQIPITGAHGYTAEHKQKVRDFLNSSPNYATFLPNNLCLDIPLKMEKEFTSMVQAGDDEAVDFLIDMALSVKAFGLKYNNFEAYSPYSEKTDFAGRNTLVSDVSKLCGIEGVIPAVSTAVITNPQNQIVMKGETVKDTKGTSFLQGKWLDSIDPDRHDKNPDFVYPHDNPQCLKSIADLALMYALMGKPNYDFGDLAYHYDEKTNQITDFYIRSVNITPGYAENEMEINLPMIDEKAAIAMTNADPNEYRQTLESQGISGKALSLAMKRFGIIKEKLENGEIEIVKDWSRKSLKDINKDYSEKVKLSQNRSFRESLTDEQTKEIEGRKNMGLFSTLFYPKQTFTEYYKRVPHCEVNLGTKIILTAPGEEYKAPVDKPMSLTAAGTKKVPKELQNNVLKLIEDLIDPMTLQSAVQLGMVSPMGSKYTYTNEIVADFLDSLKDHTPIQVYKPGQIYPIVLENVSGNLYISEKGFEHEAVKNSLPAYGAELRLALSELYGIHKRVEGNTSPEYKAFESSLESLLGPLRDNPEMSLTKEMLDKAMPNILEKCNAYEKHCMEDKKIFGSSKREERLNVCRAIQNIAGKYISGVESPRADLENDIKERIINTLITTALLPGSKNQKLRDFAEEMQENKELRDSMKANLADSPRFRELMQKKTSIELNKLLNSDTKSFINEVVAGIDGNKLMQTQVQQRAAKNENPQVQDSGLTR